MCHRSTWPLATESFSFLAATVRTSKDRPIPGFRTVKGSFWMRLVFSSSWTPFRLSEYPTGVTETQANANLLFRTATVESCREEERERMASVFCHIKWFHLPPTLLDSGKWPVPHGHAWQRVQTEKGGLLSCFPTLGLNGEYKPGIVRGKRNLRA